MRTILVITFSFLTFLCSAQAQIDTLAIDKYLLSTKPHFNDTINIDTRLSNIVLAFDRQYYSIVGYWKHPPYRHTIIRGNDIKIRHLISKQKTLEYILTDSSNTLNQNYRRYWAETSPDTSKFLTSMGVQSDYDTYYPDYTMPVTKQSVSPYRIIYDNSALENIIFDSKALDESLRTLIKNTKSKNVSKLLQYLSDNYDYFDKGKKTFDAKSVSITDITFTDNNVVYIGADIYGTHYLITLDTLDNHKFVTKKRLWVN